MEFRLLGCDDDGEEMPSELELDLEQQAARTRTWKIALLALMVLVGIALALCFGEEIALTMQDDLLRGYWLAAASGAALPALIGTLPGFICWFCRFGR